MDYQIETRCIHHGDNRQPAGPFGTLTVPIFQTATFGHPGIGQTTGYNYTRESNPTRTELEKTVNALERTADTLACASGMAAIGLVMELFSAGDHIVCSEDLYGGSVRMFQTICEKRGLEFSYVDTSDTGSVPRAIRENTKALYIETPSNPMMQITDLAEMRRIADAYGLLLIVDNTFLSPYYQNPIDFGADLILHSGTKFLGGHNDTLAGFVCVGNEKLAGRLRYLYKTVGSALSPFDSFLLIRGIKTLAVRMERQQNSALAIARWLKGHPRISHVYYVGLEDHPGYEVNLRQSRGFGSMISLRTDSPQTARTVLERIRLITFAESLGGVESLMTYPMLQTHGDVPKETRERLGITEDLLRLSVGIEHVEDLIRDLEQALA